MSTIQPAGDVAFPQQEYAGRLGKVLERMSSENLDLLVVHNTPNIAYLTGYAPACGNAYAVLLIRSSGECVIQLPAADARLVPPRPWMSDVAGIPAAELGNRFELTAELVAEIGGARIGLEKGRYPLAAAAAAAIAARLPAGSELADASQLILGLRHVKSPLEVDAMRRAAELSGIGMQAAAAAVGVGNTDNDIGAAAYASMLRHGSEAPYPAPFIMIGARTGWGPHLSWKRFGLQAGDVVNMEMTGVHQRYAAPLYRTAVVGPPSDVVRRVCDAVIECVNVVLETAAPGEPAGDVARRATEKLDPIRDIVYCTGQVSYGVGLTLSPNWVEHSFRIIEGNQQPLVPGMTFHAPTAVRLPGKFAVSFSETWVMGDKGPEILTDMPRELIIGTA
jgi:Xaa-Pro dipeptidase